MEIRGPLTGNMPEMPAEGPAETKGADIVDQTSVPAHHLRQPASQQVINEPSGPDAKSIPSKFTENIIQSSAMKEKLQECLQESATCITAGNAGTKLAPEGATAVSSSEGVKVSKEEGNIQKSLNAAAIFTGGHLTKVSKEEVDTQRALDGAAVFTFGRQLTKVSNEEEAANYNPDNSPEKKLSEK